MKHSNLIFKTPPSEGLHPHQAWLPDGTEIRLVPIERTAYRPLYVSAAGHPYSHVLIRDKQTGLYIWEFHRLKPAQDTTSGSKYNPNRKQRYLKMSSDYGNILLSHAVALAWNGPRLMDAEGKLYECHHLNGVTTDNRNTNLIWLSHAEHRLFDTIQAALRTAGRKLTSMSPGEIISITRNYRLVDPVKQMEVEMTHHMEV